MESLDYTNKKWNFLKIFWTICGVYGVISLSIFIFNPTNYRVYLSNPDDPTIILEINNNWGLSSTTHPLEFQEHSWKFQKIKKVIKFENGGTNTEYDTWTSVPDISDIYCDD